MEKGKSQPDVVISEAASVLVRQKSTKVVYSKSLCLDTLCLAIFTKNAIDVKKLTKERKTKNLTSPMYTCRV